LWGVNYLWGKKNRLELEYLPHIFPKGLLEHFKITGFLELGNVEDKTIFYEIQLEENNIILGDFDQNLYESKGFTEVVLQDFPIRGKAVFLRFKRRRWRLKSDKSKVVRNDFSFVAVGSGFTQELSDFLKDSGRYTGRYDHEHQ
jgi:hypothetical protein